MGNTQDKPKPNLHQFKQIKEKEEVLKNNFTCPNCLKRFLRGSPVKKTEDHIRMCITNGDDRQDNSYPNVMAKIDDNNDYIFEKIPDDEKGIRFSWSRVLKKEYSMEINKFLEKPEKVKSWEFQQKLNWFRAKLQNSRISWEHGCDWIIVDKNKILETSIGQVQKADMHREIKIDFVNQKVSDAGGVLRDWIHMLTKQIYDIKPSLFNICDSDEISYKLRYDPEIDQFTALNILSLLGTIMGKAIFQKIPLTTYLDRSLLRIISGNKVTLQDIYSYDKGLYYAWRSLLDSPVTQDFDLYFSVIYHTSKGIQEVDLKKNGRDIPVTQQNKKQYIELCINEYCLNRVNKFINAIKQSLHKVIPESCFSVFKPYQLEMIMYGVPFIDLQDWRINTEYRGAFNENHKVVKWFWNYLSEIPQQKLSKILHFCTGSSRTPIHGFQKLETNRGNYSKFMIESSSYNPNDPYPKGHTCFNRLQMPVYPTKALLQQSIKMISECDTAGIYGLD